MRSRIIACSRAFDKRSTWCLTQRTLALRSLVCRCRWRRSFTHSGCRSLVRLQAPHCQFCLVCSAAGQQPRKSADGPKTGLVGPARFLDSAAPGTYHDSSEHCDDKIDIVFEMDAGRQLTIQAPVGSNLLRAAEAAEAVKLNRDFCFEGSCELCQFEVEAGAQELGSKAQPGEQELVRGCLTPIPGRQSGTLHVKVLSEEDVWAQGVL
ncbi:hypothetical protein ABBQ38_008011 [Trebouxia sp. C0009 RCD-2024]